MFEEPEANAAEIQAITAAGAFIMGRNMFGPGRDDLEPLGVRATNLVTHLSYRVAR